MIIPTPIRVRFGSDWDIATVYPHVRLGPNNGLMSDIAARQKSAKSGHRATHCSDHVVGGCVSSSIGCLSACSGLIFVESALSASQRGSRSPACAVLMMYLALCSRDADLTITVSPPRCLKAIFFDIHQRKVPLELDIMPVCRGTVLASIDLANREVPKWDPACHRRRRSMRATHSMGA